MKRLTNPQKIIIGGLIVFFVVSNMNVVQAQPTPSDPRKSWIENEVESMRSGYRASVRRPRDEF